MSTTETLEQCKICSELTIKATEQRQLRRSILFIVNFEQISRIVWFSVAEFEQLKAG